MPLIEFMRNKTYFLVLCFFVVFVFSCQKNFEQEIAQTKAFLAKGQYAEAIREADKILTDRDLAEVYNLRGVALLSTEQSEKALQDFNKAIKLGGENLPYKYFYNRGNTFLKLGKPEDAWRDYEKAAELDSTVFEIYWNKANALAQLNRHGEAQADFGKAISLNPTHHTIYLQRGASNLALNKYREAQTDFAKTIELKPDSEKAYYLWAVAEMSLSDQKTNEYLEKAKSLGSMEAEVLLEKRKENK